MEDKRFPFSQNSIWSLFMVIALFVFAACSFDFYYDLNDDVMIKDILSGAYTGMPDAHSIQMLYPISLIISMCYRLIPALPWQGLFLCICHGVCFYLIANRSLVFVGNKWKKVFLLLAEAAIILVLFVWELVIVQYTITSALLAAVACFLVVTSDIEPDCDWRKFIKQQIIPILLVVLAFNIRSELLLLMSPFIAFSGILKWAEEKKAFAVENIKKYIGLIVIILVGMGISLLADSIAYSGSDWKEFRDFFNARTQVYDYTWYPSYEEAEEFYQEIGVGYSEYVLLDNYNFGLDESIDAELLWSIAEYQEENSVKIPLATRIKDVLTTYKWRTLHEDMPYSYMVLMAYVAVIGLAICKKDISVLWKVPLLIVFRSVSWMYVILANRVPARISHSLYYIEFIILCAWIFSYCRRCGKGIKWIGWICAGMLTCYACVSLPGAYKSVEAEMGRRESVNETMKEFDAYAQASAENYYYMDVYSTVAFSEKMFENVDNSQKNYDLPGGWVSGSPLQKRATFSYHNESLSEAELLLKDNFYFVIEKERALDFLHEYYATQGITLSTEVIDKIGNEENPLVIYEVSAFGF